MDMWNRMLYRSSGEVSTNIKLNILLYCLLLPDPVCSFLTLLLQRNMKRKQQNTGKDFTKLIKTTSGRIGIGSLGSLRNFVLLPNCPSQGYVINAYRMCFFLITVLFPEYQVKMPRSRMWRWQHCLSVDWAGLQPLLLCCRLRSQCNWVAKGINIIDIVTCWDSLQFSEKKNDLYAKGQCQAEVCDIVKEDVGHKLNIPDASLDFVIMIFVLSAISPGHYVEVVTRLARVRRGFTHSVFPNFLTTS